MKERFVLVGPNAGKSGFWGGRQFVDGVHEMTGSPEEISAVERLMGLFYSAYPESDVKAGLIEDADVKASEKATADEAKKLEGDQALAQAIGSLDTEADGDWTSNNLPSLDRLREMLGREVKRAEVEAIAPNYTRAAARRARQG